MNKQPNKKKKVIKKKKNTDVQNIVSNKKLKYMLIFIIFLFILLIIRLFFLQFVQGETLTNMAVNQQTTSETISSKRGNIYDSTGAALAISETVDTISINPKKLVKKKDEDTKTYKELVAKGLSEIFKLDYNETLKKVNSENSVEIIAKKVEEDKVNELKKWIKDNKIGVGINFDEDSKRYYPYNTLAAQVIGACGTDNQGLSGIEYSYDSILKGVSGQIVTSTDAAKGEIPNAVESFVAAEDGYNLTLTLDVKIQEIVENHLKEAVETNKCSRGGNCIIMDPSNGHILAMASYPTYNLNDPYTPTSYFADNWDKLSAKEKSERIYNMWSVRSVSEMYEPGSVFKLVTSSVALEENITTTNKEGDTLSVLSPNMSWLLRQKSGDDIPDYETDFTTGIRENSFNPYSIHWTKNVIQNGYNRKIKLKNNSPGVPKIELIRVQSSMPKSNNTRVIYDKSKNANDFFRKTNNMFGRIYNNNGITFPVIKSF